MATDDDHIGDFEIIANGEPFGTVVRALKTGAVISGVQSIYFKHDAGSLPELSITVIGDFKVKAPGVIHHSQARQPYGGRPAGKTKAKP